ncbi:hypothetical protein AB0L56_18030 [Streptomyces sp. NPDC052079]|uniref:hypothetical protein n=1 Tax=Streptomyces sp. NPDC052079 TaxID=3155526 RepID=UPI003439169E
MVEEAEIAGPDAATEFGAQYVRHDRCCLGLDARAVSPPLHGDMHCSKGDAACGGGVLHALRKALVRDLGLFHDGDQLRVRLSAHAPLPTRE